MDSSSDFSDDSEAESEYGSSSSGSNFSGFSPERPFIHSSSSHGADTKKPNKSLNVLQKLYNREIRGHFSSHFHDPNLRLFDKIPNANRIRLRDILPESALHKGHICMGLSKCGQFLLTYTHSNDIDVIMLSNVHKYRLHWWLFVPHLRARKVAEVMLFGSQDVYCELHISVCQWPTDTSKLLVYGHCHRLDNCQFSHAHMTITTVPSLNKCQDCLKVAASYEEDDLAANWDSCVRFSCLKHGLTIHSNFDVVSPYPKFDANVSMKRDGVVLFNTGNFLHLLRAELENIGAPPIPSCKKPDKVLATSSSMVNNLETFNHTDEERAALFRNLDTESRLGEKDSRMGAYLENCNAHNAANGANMLPHLSVSSNILSGLNKDCRSSSAAIESVSDGFWANLREIKGNVSEGSLATVSNSSSSNDASFRSCETSVNVSATEKDSLVSSLSMCLNDAKKEESSTEILGETDGEKILRELNELNDRKRTKTELDYEENAEISSTNTSVRDISFADLDYKDTDTESGMFSPAQKRAKLEDCDCDAPPAGKTDKTSFMDYDQELNIMCLSPCLQEDYKAVFVSPAVSVVPDCTECGRRKAGEVTPNKNAVKVRKNRGAAAVKLSSPSTMQQQQPTTPHKATEVYEFTEEASDDCEKLSMYRRRRLAEKKYEFCEEGEDAENIVPYRIHRNIKGPSSWIYSPSPHLPPSPLVASHRRKQQQQQHHDECCADPMAAAPLAPGASPKSPSSGLSVDVVLDQDKVVLRPFNRNNVAGICLLSPRDADKDWAKPSVDAADKDWAKPNAKKTPTVANLPNGLATLKTIKEEAPSANQNTANDPAVATHTTQYKRRYIEVEDELVSVITDIEDDDCSGSPAYQYALPVSVHGTGYSQLQMISNSKADKLMAPGVVVRQMSFDVEAFCHETSARLCEEAGKKYSFCTDYDVEIMDVCPFTCEVVVVAAMRILTQNPVAASKPGNGNKQPQHTGGRLANNQREQYQAECTFVWNTDTGTASIVRTSPLRDAGQYNLGGPYSTDREQPWGPARGIVLGLRKTQADCPTDRPVRAISNETVFKAKSFKCLVDLENLIEIAL